MREKTIEKKLVIAIKDMGGIAPKFMCPGFDGMPDRIVLLPGGRMGFVEVKAPGKHPWKAEVNEDDTSVPATTISGWYTQVYEPTFTAEG